MRSLRMTGIALAAAATVLWGLMVLAMWTADPADGANIGAGLAGLLAMVLSTAASISLLVAVARGRSPSSAVAPPGRRQRIPWAAAGLAVLSLVTWPVMWVGAYAFPHRIWGGVLVAGVAAMVVSSLLLFRAGAGRSGRSG